MFSLGKHHHTAVVVNGAIQFVCLLKIGVESVMPHVFYWKSSKICDEKLIVFLAYKQR